MDHYNLTVYHSSYHCGSAEQSQLTWIELQDKTTQKTHIFSFVPKDLNGGFGGCGYLKKKKSIPEDVQQAVHMSLTKIAFTEMVREGNCLHNRFLFYDDGNDIPPTQFN